MFINKECFFINSESGRIFHVTEYLAKIDNKSLNTILNPDMNCQKSVIPDIHTLKIIVYNYWELLGSKQKHCPSYFTAIYGYNNYGGTHENVYVSISYLSFLDLSIFDEMHLVSFWTCPFISVLVLVFHLVLILFFSYRFSSVSDSSWYSFNSSSSFGVHGSSVDTVWHKKQ